MKLPPGVLVQALTQRSTFEALGRFLSGLYETICASRGTQICLDAPDRRISLTLH